ncbi:MAG: hypothetical protein R3A52_00145 [Polyangiales bacterium]
MAKPVKPVRPSRAKPAPKPAPPEAPTDVAPAPSEETAPRYTWEEIRAKVKPASPDELAVYAVNAADAELVALGARLRSERILTDLRTWIGQILDWRSRARTATFGFSDARLRVIVHHAFALQDLLDRSSVGARARIEHAQAVARADRAYREAQHARSLLRQVLDQAARAESGFADKVAAADTPASDPVALEKPLGALLAIVKEELAKNSAVGKVLAADNVNEATLQPFTKALDTLRETHSATRGAAHTGPVSQAEIDRHDGLCLTMMDDLRGLFRELREVDRAAPALMPRATASVFGRRRRAEAQSEKETPTEKTPDAPAAQG